MISRRWKNLGWFAWFVPIVFGLLLMPLVGLLTCILIGWTVKPKTIIDEVTRNGEMFRRRKLYIVMVKVIAPLMLALLLLRALGVI